MRLSTRAQTLQESAIRKLDGLIQQLEDVHFYRLNIGQPDVHTPAPMLNAIRNFNPNVLSYGPASGTPQCRSAFAHLINGWRCCRTFAHLIKWWKCCSAKSV